MEQVRAGVIDLTRTLGRVESLIEVIPAYEAFDQREPGWIKVGNENQRGEADPLHGAVEFRFKECAAAINTVRDLSP